MIALADRPDATNTAPVPIDELLATVSASRLNTFHQCRLKFFFRYVLELSKPTTAAFLTGKAVHAALQKWSVARWRGGAQDQESIKTAFLESWKTLQDEQTVEWEEGAESASQERAWGLVELYLRESPIPAEEKPAAVEVRVEADIDPGLPTLVGVIDLVRPGGRIVDFKTTSTTPNSGRAAHLHENQLTAYGLLYRDATGQRESGLELHHLVKLKTPKLVVSEFSPITQQQETRLLRSVASYVDGVQRQDFIPSPGMQCVTCEFFQECCVWKGGV